MDIVCMKLQALLILDVKLQPIHLHNYIPTPHISTQKTIARFYSNIVREIRAELEYFRVGFYGAGFPPFLKVRTPVLV